MRTESLRSSLLSLPLLAAAVFGTGGMDLPAQAGAPGASASGQKATYLFSPKLWHDDSEVLAPGFLRGLRGFDHFYDPIGQPIYFESPFNDSGVRLLYLHHEFDNRSPLQGGELDIYAMQARLALTERLGFIATKDGYSEIDTGLLGSESGWNDIAFGFKYVALYDREEDLVVTPGIRYQAENGSRDVLQGGFEEISPFVSIAKGWGKLHAVGNATWRIPFDSDANQVLHYDAHIDYEVADGFAPVAELHGVSYLTDGNVTPLNVGGLDYTNLGSTDVAGSTVLWLGLGARAKFNPHTSLGFTYEFALTDSQDDIMDTRYTIDFILKW
ncbi:MAG: transporter [Planctomycetes bacterium]|nr:transporter [Planctomycetota bacterium]